MKLLWWKRREPKSATIWLRYSLPTQVSDGDKLLIVNDQTIINAAKRVTQNVVPLFYNMAKAGAMHLDNNTIFDGLMLAYTGGNIGGPSNDITKIWNSGEITEEKLKVVKWLCADVNFTID